MIINEDMKKNLKLIEEKTKFLRWKKNNKKIKSNEKLIEKDWNQLFITINARK